MTLVSVSQQDILARTIYGEARGEFALLDGGLAALIAVGNVVMNRLQAHSWFGNDVTEICQKPHQFSCWTPTDVNYPLIQQVNSSNACFMVCVRTAEHLCSGVYPDLTKGSTHYHHQAIHPSWARGVQPRVRIGRHIFYRVH